MIIVTLSGKRFSGKDTFATLLQQQLQNLDKTIEIVSSSYPLKKRFCEKAYLELERFLNDREYKERFRDQFSEFVKTQSQEQNFQQLLQTIHSLESELIIVSDLRSFYDLENLKKNFQKVVTVLINSSEKSRVQRGLKPSDYDNSDFEIQLERMNFDFVVTNNSTLEDLRKHVNELAQAVIKI